MDSFLSKGMQKVQVEASYSGLWEGTKGVPHGDLSAPVFFGDYMVDKYTPISKYISKAWGKVKDEDRKKEEQKKLEGSHIGTVG